MTAIENLLSWRQQWPEGSCLLDRMTDTAVQAGYTRVIVWGSIALADYVHGQSDIDLLLVSSGKSLALWNAPEGAVGGQWEFEMLAITEEALQSTSPVALRHANAGMPYELHGMDLVQLKEWSIPIAGTGIRDLLPPRDTRTEALLALKYALEVMVPRCVEASVSTAGERTLDDQRLAIEFVLIRCLYSATHGAVTSKRTAVTWACEKYRTDPAYAVISEAGARLLAYREGWTQRLPQASDLAALSEAIGEVTDSMARLKQ